MKTKTKTKSKRALFAARFKELYPGRRLLAVQLDGFTHSVIHDNGTSAGAVIRSSFSHCMPEGHWSDQAAGMFHDIEHHVYQGAAEEIIYILPEAR